MESGKGQEDCARVLKAVSIGRGGSVVRSLLLSATWPSRCSWLLPWLGILYQEPLRLVGRLEKGEGGGSQVRGETRLSNRSVKDLRVITEMGEGEGLWKTEKQEMV